MTKKNVLFYLIISSIFINPVAFAEVNLRSVEPPSWWVGMSSQKLQLMLHGDKLANYQVTTSSNSWQIESVETSDNANYLFINLRINDNAKAGNYPLTLRSKDGKAIHTINYSLNQRRKNSANREGFNSSDVIYLITPDRFVNGDYSNDTVASLSEGINREYEGGRYGGDIQGIIDSLDFIESVGYTQIWLNPVLENAQEKYSYHGYSTTDYYQVDERFGSNELYRELSSKAKQKGIGLIKDIILNHIGSGHPWMRDMPNNDWINHGTQFVSTNHRRESLHDPYGTEEDREGMASGWFVPTMPDLNQRNEKLATYLIQNSIWWVEYADLSGIRLDTYPYPDKDFLTRYTREVMAEYPNLNIVGEEWSLNPITVAYWQKGKQRHDNYESYLRSVMDFPLQDAVVKGLKEKESWSDGITKIYQTLATDFVYAHPEELVIFPDNHDMSRIHTQLDHDPKLTKMALAFFATTRGIPQIFYGTEVLMDNPGTDSHGIIRSEFPGGWKDHQASALTGKGLSPDAKSMLEFTRKLFTWRKSNPLIHNGKLTHYAPQDGVYVYFRTRESKAHQSYKQVMVIMNKNDQDTEVKLERFNKMLGNATRATNIISGQDYILKDTIMLPSKTALVLEF
ncbi:alpha-amlyase [Aliikangiella marina]|uniref:Alpha-amlyase n=1 Tax=Aliikangiella marina TaxID=1712262 RepID=A0A545TCU2_9GAMM|nr:glycoside hydrolase family 13 protein [Aliikangiella marina]TQV75038.1 alpha-amlyase [Aliikangiella marina]